MVEGRARLSLTTCLKYKVLIAAMADMKVVLDDFRLSYLFDVEDPIPESRLSNELESREFKVTKQRYIVAPPLRAVLLNLATYKGTSVLYQKDSVPAFIGVAGKNIFQVKESFGILQEVLRHIDTTTFDRSVGIEMVTTTKVFSKSLPDVTIPSLASQKIERFKNIVGGEPRLFTAQITSESDKKAWYVRIEPLLRSRKYYFVQLTYQDPEPNIANILEVGEKSETMIRQIVEVVEG